MAALPVKLLRAPHRALILEEISAKMVTTMSIPEGAIKFFTPSQTLIWRASSLLEKETDTIHWIDGLAEESVLWDVGANVGVFSLYACKKRNIWVHAFEPHAGNYHILTKNKQLNGMCDRVQAFCMALADHTRLGCLNMASPELGAALSHFGRQGEPSPYWVEKTRPETHGMIGFSIDDFLRLFNPRFPNHLKMDVDGLELSILEGARRTLKDARLRSILVELNLTNTVERDKAIAILTESGFRFVSQGAVQDAGGNHFANHLFKRECANGNCQTSPS
jgi:FkbM family methyltransferase